MDIAAWASEVRSAIVACSVQPGLGDVIALRRALDRKPTHYLGSEWMATVERARAWLALIEARIPLPTFTFPDDAPLVPKPPMAMACVDD
jgi:hypothetical protein